MLNLSSRKFVIRNLSFALVLFSAACNSSNPAGPSDTTGTTNAAATINQVLPASLPPSTAPQTIRVAGSNFKPGLTVEFTFKADSQTKSPSSEGRAPKTETFSGSAIKNLTESSFEIDVTVTEPGSYTVCVKNPDAPPSDPVIVEAEEGEDDEDGSGVPTIEGTDPVSPRASDERQSLYIEGAHFKEGLSVKLTRPNGETSTLKDGITFSSKRVIRVKVTLGEPGEYILRVVNPSGATSEPFEFEVGAAEAQAPEIKSVSPQSPVADDAPQTLKIGGRHFKAGLKVLLSGPDDGDETKTISGSAIDDVSAEMFKLSVVLAEAGEYHIRVVNPDGSTSAAKGFLVKETDGDGTPEISALDPGSPTASSTAKWLWVLGSDFAPGLSVKIEHAGSESSITIGGESIHYESSELFKVLVTLPVAGEAAIRVVNPGGASSDWKFFTVKPGESSAPTVTRIEPEDPVADNEAQPIWIIGTNFQEGLTVKLTRPGGSTSTISGEAVDRESSTVVKVMMSLGDPGTYSVKVVNPGGQTSGSLSFVVGAAD